MSDTCEFAIIGAGPYGLSAAAHLTAAGRDIRVFGVPMDFWQQRMPRGMLLRSSWRASHIAHPSNALTLEAFQASAGIERQRNLPLESFVRYALWYQQTAVPHIDRRRVVRIERNGDFRIALDYGAAILARRVLLATGLSGHEHRPAMFDHIPAELASHSSDHADFSRFRGREVAVIGGGQSAIESAALLHEAGARVEIILRAPRLRWLGAPDVRCARQVAWAREIARVVGPASEAGPFPLNWIAHYPRLYRTAPAELRQKVTYRALRPAAASWLYSRTREIPLTTGCCPRSAAVSGSRIRLELDNGTERCFDHVLLGTGYRFDLARVTLFSRPLFEAIRTQNGYPVLSSWLESSVPGLCFAGAAAAYSCGPMMRFVSGTRYASRALMQAG